MTCPGLPEICPAPYLSLSKHTRKETKINATEKEKKMKKPKRKACIDKNTRAIHILRLKITKALRKALDQPLTRPQAGGHGRAKKAEAVAPSDALALAPLARSLR